MLGRVTNMQATLNNWRGSPRKFNEYLRAVRGLRALEAADRLKFMTSPYAHALRQLILSAVANASEDSAIAPANLVLKEATVGRAMFLKRVCFRGRGRMGRVTRFGSNVKVVLGTADAAANAAKSAKATKVGDNKPSKAATGKAKAAVEKAVKTVAAKKADAKKGAE